MRAFLHDFCFSKISGLQSLILKLIQSLSLLQITFSPALSREFRPYKPDPGPLLHICSTWEVQPNEVMMVGDSLKDDVSSYSC